MVVCYRSNTRALSAWFALLIGIASPADAGGPNLRMSGEEWAIFDHDTQACDVWDIPDTPMRAYRASDGSLRVFQTHHQNRAFVGADFGSLKRDCKVVFKGNRNDDPAVFDDLSWIASTWTQDGKNIYAIIHNEYQGHRRLKSCPSGKYMECWYNGLTSAYSNDEGNTFSPSIPKLIASIPFRADQTIGDHAGYFEPSNIIHWNNAWYFTANIVSPRPQKNGNCLLRSTDIADPTSWRAWNGRAFETKLVNPYDGSTNPYEHLCEPLSRAGLPWPVTNVVLHERTSTWIAVMKGGRTDASGQSRSGFYYSTSKDLVNWVGPRLFWETPIGTADCSSGMYRGYPALIDPNSKTRNFETITDHPILTFVETRMKDCKASPSRNLKARHVDIDDTEPLDGR